MLIKDYIRASSLEEASERYAAGGYILFAGGTDLMVKARGKKWYQDKTFLDISGLQELKEIREEENFLCVGAAVTLTELEENREVRERLPLLYEAVRSVGSTQIRNRATLAGNLANACPASDCIPALVTLGAQVEVYGGKGKRVIPAEQIFRECRACLRHSGMHVRTCYYSDPTEKKLILEPGEMICGIRIPFPKPGTGHWFYKLTQNRTIGMAVMNLSMTVEPDERGKARRIRLSAGGIFPRPVCLETVRGENAGKSLREACLEQAVNAIEQEKDLLADYPYKRRVFPELIEEGLEALLPDGEEDS